MQRRALPGTLSLFLDDGVVQQMVDDLRQVRAGHVIGDYLGQVLLGKPSVAIRVSWVRLTMFFSTDKKAVEENN